MKKVNILGNDYKINFIKNSEDKRLNPNGVFQLGNIEYFDKVINIYNHNHKRYNKQMLEVLIHEISHAIDFQCGLLLFKDKEAELTTFISVLLDVIFQNKILKKEKYND